MTGIEEVEFLLPRDVVICPVEKLAPSTRRQISCSGDEYAVSRPHLRLPSKLVNRDTALLLGQFAKPSSIVDAVARFSQASEADPMETLEASFEALRSLIAGQILVPGTDAPEEAPKGRFVRGMEIAGCEIVRVIQSLEDCAVYEGISKDGRTVAVKVVPALAAPIAHTMLRHEAQALRLLNGTCAPALLAQGEQDGDRYLVLEWIAGRDAASEAARLRLGGISQRPALFKLCLRVLRCFAQLHHAGVIQGDVHPDNVVVTASGAVRLLDFGRSALTRVETKGIPRAGVGQYYEPELAASLAAHEAPPAPSEAGEQYAVAALLYELMTGQSYAEFSLEREALLRQVLQTEPRPFALCGIAPWPAAEAVLLRALAKDPSRRFSSMAEFATRFSLAEIPRRPHRGGAPLTETIADEALPTTAEVAWFLFRSAIVREDAQLLAKADSLAENAGAAQEGRALTHYVRARIAHARCDSYSRALHDFGRALQTESVATAMPAICWFLAQGVTDSSLRDQAERFVRSYSPQDSGCAESYAWLQATCRLGILRPDELASMLRELAEKERGWISGPPAEITHRIRFWALANQLVSDDSCHWAGEHVALACFNDHKGDPARRAFGLLEWYRCTGDDKWLSRAKLLAARLPAAAPSGDGSPWMGAQLRLELEKPEISEFPIWL